MHERSEDNEGLCVYILQREMQSGKIKPHLNGFYAREPQTC